MMHWLSLPFTVAMHGMGVGEVLGNTLDYEKQYHGTMMNNTMSHIALLNVLDSIAHKSEASFIYKPYHYYMLPYIQYIEHTVLHMAQLYKKRHQLNIIHQISTMLTFQITTTSL